MTAHTKNKNILSLLLIVFIAADCVQARPAAGLRTRVPETLSVKYDFIRYQDNYIICDTASPNLICFIKKWNQVTSSGAGNINIVHIGGSHVQAGTLPHRIRQNILQAYPGLVGPRGMIFPYSAAAKCNNPADYRVHCREKVILTRNVYKEPEYNMGLCGISITAVDTPTSVQIILNEPRFDFSSSQITVLGESPDDIVPIIRLQDRDVPPSYINARYHRYVYNLSNSVDSFALFFPCDSGQTFTLTGICLSNRRAGISYHSIGVNGAAVPDFFKCRYFSDDLKLVKPDLVIFGIGINDAAGAAFDTLLFRQNYSRLMDSILAINPDCAFLFITNNDSYRHPSRRTYTVNTNGLLAREVFYRLARENKAALWDQFHIMGGLKSMEKWKNARLAQTDRVHFTHAGYELVGDLFSQAFLEWISHFPISTAASGSRINQKTVKQNPQDSEIYQYISY